MKNLVSYIEFAIGSILFVAPIGTQAIGLALITHATLTVAAGFIFKPSMNEGDNEASSSSYGFDQFRNPFKGDTPLPIVYSNDTADAAPGHKVSPVYIQAFTTPRGSEIDDDDPKQISSQGQGLSVLLAVAEGPIKDIYDIRANDEPLYEERTGVKVDGKPDGTKKTFHITGKRIELDSVRVYSDGTLKGWQTREKTELMAIGDGSKILFFKAVDEALFVSENALQFRLNSPTATVLGTDSTTGVRPMAWFSDGGKGGASSKLYVNTQVPLASGQKLYVTWTERYCDGFSAKFIENEKRIELKFTTAPASGTVLTCDYRRRRIPGLRVEWRCGGDAQFPIPDFSSVRNTVAVLDGTLATGTASAWQKTSEEVDDLIIDIASGDEGFTQFDNKTGVRSPVSATFRIEYQALNADDTTSGSVETLRDPGGAFGTKSNLEFRMQGDQTSRKYYSVSIRNTLRHLSDKDPTNTGHTARLDAFKRRKWQFRVTRTNKVLHDTTDYVLDEIVLLSYQKVVDEQLMYPGVALIGLHGYASDRLQGGAPQITCKVRGTRNVEAYSAGTWTAAEANQANPVWAAIDLVTSLRYGGGSQFTKALNIDTTSAVAAAAYCDATVTLADGTTEKRAVLDYVIDTRADLMSHVRTMLAPAGIIPVLRGNVLAFVIDEAATLSSVPVVYDDTTEGRTLRDSMSCSHQPSTTQITELQVSYFDRADDFERNEVWMAPTAPASDRRIERAEAKGCTRISQATRYATFLYEKARQQGVNLGWAMTPGGLRLQAGDVCRVVSNRLGIDLYARITKWELVSSEDMVIRIEAAQYVPAVYGQDAAKQTILTRSASSGQSAAVSSSSVVAASGKRVTNGRVAARVRRVA